MCFGGERGGWSTLHAPTISLEEYGVVLKPGRIMSTADVTHVQQGFRIPIPRVDEEARIEVPVVTLCERYLRTDSSREGPFCSALFEEGLLFSC